eukprot:g3543.t1
MARYGDVIMARVKSRNQIAELARYSTVPVVNGLDDFAHPAQILADLLSIRQAHCLPHTAAQGWSELRLAYVGDTHNNVTYDLMRAAALVGFHIRVSGPPFDTYKIEEEVLRECEELCRASGGTVTVVKTAEEAVAGADVVYTDSWSSYGIPEQQKQTRISQLQPYQVNAALLARTKPTAIFMNCLPAMRGHEQTAEVIDGPRSIVFDQAENRLHAQKALLCFLLDPKQLKRTSGATQAAGAKAAPPPRQVGKARVVVALGGNALCKPGQKGTAEEQTEALEVVAQQMVRILRDGFHVVISHGNGPQVGAVLLQNEAGKAQVPAMPLEVCVSETQGEIGYLIQSSLRRHLHAVGDSREVVTLITEVEVDPQDPGFSHLSKPVGPFYSQDEAKKMTAQGMAMVEDAGRGYRRVVASPKPIRCLQASSVRCLLEQGALVVAAGGGGIPVADVTHQKVLRGVPAVIDKDYASKVLAMELGAEILMILTDVPCAYLFYTNKQKRQALQGVFRAAQLREYVKEGHFAAGSMLPKVLAACEFAESKTGRRAIITSLQEAHQALCSADAPCIGTHVVL